MPLTFGSMGDPSKAPRGRGGRVGQQHRAVPADLREFDVTPASDVVVTRPDGTIDRQPARQAKAGPAPRRRPAKKKRGAPVCGMCGYAITDTAPVVSKDRFARGKPVHRACEDRARSVDQARAAQRQAEKAERAAAQGGPRKMTLAQENRWLREQQDKMRAAREPA